MILKFTYFFAPIVIAACMPVDVTALSDDEKFPIETGAGKVKPAPVLSQTGLQQKRTDKFGRKPPCALNPAQIRGELGHFVAQTCRCSTSSRKFSARTCLKQFRKNVEELFQVRWRLQKLHKADADAQATLARLFWRHHLNFLSMIGSFLQVVKLLQPGTPDPGKIGQTLLGKPVCQSAFKKLLGIGSDRYAKLKRCAINGVAAPMDLRTVGRKMLIRPKLAKKRELIVEFLEWLYTTVSEPMPEATGQVKRKVDDAELDQGDRPKKPMHFRRLRGRRPKLARVLNRGKDGSALRMLPPASYSDYLSLLRAKHPEETFSLKLFTNDIWLQSEQT